MSDRALENAQNAVTELLERRKAILKELEEIDTRLAQTNGFIRQWHEFAGIQARTEAVLPALSATVFVQDFPSPSPLPSLQSAPRTKNPPRRVVVERALSIIEKNGEPLSREDLYTSLREEGILIVGKDPLMVLSTMLWRERDKIVRLPKHGYWPAHLPYRPALYDPEMEDILGSTDETEPEILEEPAEEDDA